MRSRPNRRPCCDTDNLLSIHSDPDRRPEEEGVLVFDEHQRLVAVLVRLSERNEIAPGQWFLEAGFGPLGGVAHPAFADLDTAQNWISQRLPRWAWSGSAGP
jgi:hypothetical protein